VTLRHRIRFYQQLAVLMRAGLPIRASLLRLKERMSGREVTILSQKINEGDRLGEAFIAAGFSPFECHLVVAGERSGHLDTVFEHLSEFWKRQLEMHQALIRPLYYPIAVLHFAVLVGAVVESVMMTTTLPVVVFHFVLRMAALYFLGFLLYFLVRSSWSNVTARRIWLRMPIIGTALNTAYAYRWITALRIEFTAGVSLASAVGDAWRASGYVEGDQLAAEGEQAMREGVQLSALVQRWNRLPRDWVDFIETGEISGALEAAFKNLEAEASRAWKLAEERMADWLPKIVYFFVILVVAVVVGRMMYQVEVAPMVDVEKQIDNAGR
jgi:type II secretory pathway component PulF